MSAWDHVQVTCCNCGATIALHRQHHQQLKRTHETFYCPNGHPQHFAGKTDEQMRIEVLERQLDSWREWAEDWRDAKHDLAVAATICPLGCGFKTDRRLCHRPSEEEVTRFLDRVWGDLREHLVQEHNATVQPIALLGSGEEIVEAEVVE